MTAMFLLNTRMMGARKAMQVSKMMEVMRETWASVSSFSAKSLMSFLMLAWTTLSLSMYSFWSLKMLLTNILWTASKSAFGVPLAMRTCLNGFSSVTSW